MSGQLGELVISLSADIARFQADMGKAVRTVESSTNQMTSTLENISGAFGKIGNIAAGVTAMLAGGAMFGSFISTTKDVTGEITKLSRTLGISAEQASVLRVALDDAFLTTEDMVAGTSRLTRQLATNEEAFAKLGVETRDQNGNYRDSLDIMTDVNSALSKIKEGTDQNVAGMSIYGKSWGEVRGLLRLTNEAMTEAKERAEQLHLIFGAEGLKAVKEYKLAMKDLDDVAESFKVTIGKEMLPVLTSLAVSFGEAGAAAATAFAPALRDSIRFVADLDASLTRFIAKANEFGATDWLNKESRGSLSSRLAEVEKQYQKEMEENAKKYGNSVKPVSVYSGKPDASNFSIPTTTADEAEEKVGLTVEKFNAFMAKFNEDWAKIDLDTLLAEGEATTALTGSTVQWKPKDQKFSLMGPEYSGFYQEVQGQGKKDYRGYVETFGSEEDISFQYATDMVDRLNEAHEQGIISTEEYHKKVEEQYAAHSDRMRDMELQRAEMAATIMGGQMQQLGQLFMQGSKDQFEAGKALAIAGAMIDTAAAAISAYKAMAGIPVVGPYLGAAAAAMAVTYGVAQVAMIQSAQYQPRADGGPVSAGETYLVGEKGPELLTMGQPGVVTPNKDLRGGGDVNVTNVFQVSAGVAEAVESEVRRVMPAINAATVRSVRQAIESGGPLARSVGRM